MKKLFYVSIAVLVLGVLLTGCGKDEDPVKNSFTAAGTEYELSSGVIVSWEETSTKGVYSVDLVLLSKGIGINDMGMPTGKGNALYFQMLSSTLTDLPDGTYFYGKRSDNSPKTYFQGDAMINYDSTTMGSQTDISITSGTVTIKKSGSEYEIYINCTGSNGKGVTGYYKGSLTKI